MCWRIPDDRHIRSRSKLFPFGVGAWGKDHTLKLACLQCKNSPDWESFCGIVISEPNVKHVQHVVLLHTSHHLKSSPWLFSSDQKLSPKSFTQLTGSQKDYSNTHSSIWKKSSWCFGIHKSNSAGGFTIWTKHTQWFLLCCSRAKTAFRDCRKQTITRHAENT